MMNALTGKYRYYWMPDLYRTIVITDNGGSSCDHDHDYQERVTTFKAIICHPSNGTFDLVYDDDSIGNAILLKTGDIRYNDITYTRVK